MADYASVKEEGNKYFNESKYGDAAACYTKALSLSNITGNDKAVLLKNRAACYLKLDKSNEAIADCTAGLYLLVFMLIFQVNLCFLVPIIFLPSFVPDEKF